MPLFILFFMGVACLPPCWAFRFFLFRAVESLHHPTESTSPPPPASAAGPPPAPSPYVPFFRDIFPRTRAGKPLRRSAFFFLKSIRQFLSQRRIFLWKASFSGHANKLTFKHFLRIPASIYFPPSPFFLLSLIVASLESGIISSPPFPSGTIHSYPLSLRRWLPQEGLGGFLPPRENVPFSSSPGGSVTRCPGTLPNRVALPPAASF